MKLIPKIEIQMKDFRWLVITAVSYKIMESIGLMKDRITKFMENNNKTKHRLVSTKKQKKI